MYSAFDSASLHVTRALGGDAENAAIVSDTVGTEGIEENGRADGVPEREPTPAGEEDRPDLSTAENDSAEVGAGRESPREEG